MTLPEVGAQVIGVSVQDTDGADIGNNYISGDGNHAIFLGAYANDKAVQAGRVGIQLPTCRTDLDCSDYYALAPFGAPLRKIEKCDWSDGYFLPVNLENLMHPGFRRTVDASASGFSFKTETHGVWFDNGSWEPLAYRFDEPAYPCKVFEKHNQVDPDQL